MSLWIDQLQYNEKKLAKEIISKCNEILIAWPLISIYGGTTSLESSYFIHKVTPPDMCSSGFGHQVESSAVPVSATRWRN